MFIYRRFLLFCLLLILLPGLTLLFSDTAYVQTTSGFVYPAEPNDAVVQPTAVAAGSVTGAFLPAADAKQLSLTGHRLPITPLTPAPSPQFATASLQDDEICYQLLGNPQLDVLEIEGFNVVEPWVPLVDYVYFDTDIHVSPVHSLFLWDADVDDPSPDVDAFAQAFFMPTDLTRVSIDYFTRTFDTNLIDQAFGNFWTIDEEGFLDEFLGGWEVTDSDGVWQNQTVPITDTADLAPLEGQQLAIILFSRTDGLVPGEQVYFDDITVTACQAVEPGISAIYLPVIFHRPITGPICVPPTENPPDTRKENRGFVQTGAICQSTLSQVDTRDYYTFSPSQSGTHTFHLRKMPSWSNWSLRLFLDVEPPATVPGPTGGECRIGTPGPNDKSVSCSLQAGQRYFILVAAGDNYSQPLGSYEMQVTRP